MQTITQTPKRNQQPLNNEQIHRLAPSVFANSPWHERTKKFCFVPTIEVIGYLRREGYEVSRVQQSRSRIPGKQDYTKHMIHLRKREDFGMLDLNQIIPEIVLVNAHDGTSRYKLLASLFRCWCLNQCTVSEMEIESLTVKHLGGYELKREVIQATSRIANQTNSVMDTVNRWKGINCSVSEQKYLAQQAIEAHKTTLSMEANRLLYSRRREDHADVEGNRDLWKVHNVIQENLIKGGVMAKGSNGRYRKSRAIQNIDQNLSLNCKLWDISAEFAALRGEVQQTTRQDSITMASTQTETVKPALPPLVQLNQLIAKYGSNWHQHLSEMQY